MLQWPFVGGGQSYAFGKIDGRTAAERNDAVAAAVAVGDDAFTYCFLRRIRRRAGEYRNGRRIEVGQHLRCNAGTLYAGVRDEQRPVNSERLQLGWQALDGTEIEYCRRQITNGRHG